MLRRITCAICRRKVPLSHKISERKLFRLFGNAAPHGVLYAALVVATDDAEVALLTPVLVPGVGDEPVLGAVLNTIAEDADGMATLDRAGGVLVDAVLVEHEVLVDGEGTLARTVGAELGHHVLLTTDSVDIRCLALVRLEVDGRIIDASRLARRSGNDLARARVGGARDVMVAAGKAVLDTLLADNTSAHPVGVSTRGIATVAGASARAAVHILSGKDDVLAVLDALTIAHGLDGTESPAGAAIRLVTDHGHGLAVGPGSASIEALGSRSTSSSRVGALRRVGRIVPGTLNIEGNKGLHLIMRKTSSGGVKRGNPQVLGAVDGLNSLTGGEGASSRGTGAESNKSSDELHPNNN